MKIKVACAGGKKKCLKNVFERSLIHTSFETLERIVLV